MQNTCSWLYHSCGSISNRVFTSFFFFFEGGWSLEAESGYVAQVSLELVVFLLQPPKCWGNSSVPTCLTSHEMTWNISTFVFILLLLYLLYAFNILHTLILPSYFLWSKTDNKQSDVWVIWIFVLIPRLITILDFFSYLMYLLLGIHH